MNKDASRLIVDDFNKAIDTWLAELERYSFDQLCRKPSDTSWSLGQLYVHLVGVTDYIIKQVRICASNNDNESLEITAAGKKMFLNNDFPDALLEGPPSNATTPQPKSKDRLKTGMLNLRNDIAAAGELVIENPYNGKTKHPGLGYFNADEWFQFGEMHLRHHFRQKKRIDEFLTTTSPA